MHDHHHSAPGRHTHALEDTTADGALLVPGTAIEPGALWAGEPSGRGLWLDVSEGASGDMLLAALLDAGADGASVARVLETVAPGKLHLQWRRVERGPFTARKVDVVADEPNPPARHLADIRDMLDADIPDATRALALDAFTRLAHAEAHVHGMGVEDVHFHEVGALDSIGDIVGVAEALRTLGVDRVTCSVVALGTGTVRTQHGLLSVPPPAVLELAKGFDVEAGGPPEAGELCTPTGLTLLRAMCASQGTMPRMRPEAIGIGAGTRVRKDRAGVVRAVVGSPAAAPVPGDAHAAVHELSANVDDLDPRLWPTTLTALLGAGARDAWLTPIIMKKGRPAHTVTALVTEDVVDAVAEALLAHTSTIGMRIGPAQRRIVLERAWVPVPVTGGEVRVKVAGDGATVRTATPEFDDVAAVAAATGAPERVVLAEAQSAAWHAGLRPGADWPEGADG